MMKLACGIRVRRLLIVGLMLHGPLIGMAQSEVEPKAALVAKLYQEGEELQTKGDHAGALNKYEASRKLAQEIGDKRAAAKNWLGIGLIKMQQGDYRKALEGVEIAKQVGEELKDQSILSRALVRIGDIKRAQIQYREAQENYQRALQIGEDGKDKGAIALALNGIGTVHILQGHYTQAVECLQRALKMNEELGAKKEIAATLNNIGIVYVYQGSYGKAVEYHQRALKMNEELGDKKEIAVALSGIGIVYMLQGSYGEAVEYYQRGVKIAEELGDKRTIAVALNIIGNVYRLQGSYGEAVEYYQRALKMNEEVGRKEGVAATLNNIGIVYMLQGSYGKAVDYFQRALIISQEIQAKSQIVRALHGIGFTHLKQQRYPQAVEAAQQALALGEEIKEPPIIWEARYILAGAYEKSGDPTQALNHYQLAVAEIEKVRAQAGSDEGKAGFFAEQIYVYENLIRFLYNLQTENPAAGYTRQAFEYAERAKARSLMDMLAESRTEIHGKISPELRKKERTILAKLSALQKSIWEQSGKKDHDPMVKKLESDRVSLEQEYDQLKRDIRRLSPEYAAVNYPEPIPLAQAQNLLDEKTALLEYVLSEESSYLFVVTRDRFGMYPLSGRAVIEKQVEKFYKTLAQPASASGSLTYLSEGHKLYKRLIQPAETLLQGKQALVIVPDGNLALLPFAALLTEIPQARVTIPFKKLPYLIRKYEISFVPSASVLQTLKGRPQPKSDEQRPLIVFADPIYEEEKRGLTAVMTAQRPDVKVAASSLRLDRIKYSGMEAEKIAALYGAGATKYLREQATEERVKATDLRPYRYVHFAAHGIVNPDRPGFSAIVLGSEGQEDGFLQLREVFDLDMQAELVVLSACESGLGKQMRGEGLVGLSRAFMYAGAQSVLASLWKVVDSPATVHFMEDFYRHLAGTNKAAALRATQLRFIRSEKYNRPFFWAAFVLMGL